MDNILARLNRGLRHVGYSRFAWLSDHTGISALTLRKLRYGELTNPGLVIVQPLLDAFEEIALGTLVMPPMPPRARRRTRAEMNAAEMAAGSHEASALDGRR